jgi:P-type Mg2+ transporter
MPTSFSPSWSRARVSVTRANTGRPGTLLLWSSVALIGLTAGIPYLPVTSVLGFVPLPGTLLATVVAITALYVLATELTKHWFYRQPGTIGS